MVEKSVRLSLRDDPQEEGHQEVGCSTRPWTTVDPSPPIAIPTGIRLTEPPAPSAPPAGATAQHSLPRQNRAAPHQAHPVPSGKWKSMLAIQVSFRTYSALPSGSSTTARHSFHQFRQSGPEYAFEGEKLVGGGLPRRPPPREPGPAAALVIGAFGRAAPPGGRATASHSLPRPRRRGRWRVARTAARSAAPNGRAWPRPRSPAVRR